MFFSVFLGGGPDSSKTPTTYNRSRLRQNAQQVSCRVYSEISEDQFLTIKLMKLGNFCALYFYQILNDQMHVRVPRGMF